MIRAVLDAHVFVSALLSPRGFPAKVLAAWQAERFHLVISPAIPEEKIWWVFPAPSAYPPSSKFATARVSHEGRGGPRRVQTANPCHQHIGTHRWESETVSLFGRNDALTVVKRDGEVILPLPRIGVHLPTF